MIRVHRNRPRRRSRIPRIPARSTTLPRILRRFYVAVIILVVATVLGTLGFHYGADPAPHWSDSLYMTLITISTVGYGEVVPVDTPAERIFTGLLSIAGFGVLTFMFTSLTVFFLESDLDYTLRRRRMERKIRKLRDHYIVCGFGRVGRNVATELRLTHRQFVVIDTQEAQLTSQVEHFPELLWLAGDASDDDQLLAADIDDALGVFAVTGDDSRNLMIALTAKHLNPNVRVVARCHEVRNMPKLRKAGADAIVSPDFTGGMRIASQMVRPHVVSFLDQMLRSEQRLRLEEVPVPETSGGCSLADIGRRGEGYVVVAVREAEDWVFNPPDEFRLQAGQVLIAMVSPDGHTELLRNAGCTG